MLISTIRSVSRKKLFKNLQFIRSQSVFSLAHFTPYFSDSGSEDLSLDSRNKSTAENFSNNDKNPFAMSSSVVVDILKTMESEPKTASMFFDQLKENGFQHNVQTYLAIIKILCIWGLRWKLDVLFKEVINLEKEHQCFEVSELLEAMAEEIRVHGPSSLAQAIDALIKSYVTLEMFDEAIDTLFKTKRHGVRPCLSSCNFLVNRLVRHGNLDTAVAIYKQLKAIGVSPNVYTYGIMIKAYCRNQCLEEATDVLFRDMEEAGVVPNAFAYSAYLEGLCMHGRGFVREKKLKEAEIVLLGMEEHGMVPNEVNYRVLVQGYCDSGDIIKALTIHNEMEARGIRTNCLVLTPILQCLSQKGMHLEAINQFKEFEKMGIFLDEVAYNVVIDALCKMGNLDEALALFDEMKCKKKLTPDVVHYTTLISGYCLHGDISDAVNLFVEMNENGLRADIITYNVLAGGLSRNGLLKEVNFLLGDMKRRGLTPSLVTHNMIIEGLCLGGKVKEAENYFTNLEDKRIENYASMVNGYCESSKAVDGYKLFLRLSDEGFQINRSCCLKLISSLCLEGENDRAVKVFEILLSSEYGPSKMMYEKLIPALCCAGDMTNARWAFDHMVRRGLSPDLILYTIMLNGYCQVNCLREAHDLFSDMKERGISPDIITYTVLLDGHSKVTLKKARSENDVEGNKKAKQVALALLCEMKELDIKPDAICYTALIDSQCKTDNIQDAISLFKAMKDQGLQPDTVTYTALLSGYCKQGDMKKAETLVDEMKANGIEADSRTVSIFDLGIVRAKKLQFRH
ncbi:hypothetical protein CASFOL_009817 [Castilleja foliolosa]|uniref:Pentatricopeptide repeat-containing protein-mitochondrial domain-containing protein n=1 Tax=Castilleja foliolosa TaxID=1961234 RepID=A0ABD3DRC8_9LAMI